MVEATVAAKITIRVLYNGVIEPLDVQPHELVGSVLQRAEDAFHITQNRHLLALFREDGTELNEQKSVSADGIKAGELLSLRPSAVKGGTR